MVRPEPVSPERIEPSDEAKFELVKAMGVAIAAIAKEKSVFITDAEVKRNHIVTGKQIGRAHV